MNPGILEKLNNLTARHEEIAHLLAEPDVIADNDRFRKLSQEYAQLEPVVKTIHTYQEAQQQITDAQEMLQESDPEMQAMARDEIAQAESVCAQLDDELKILLLPKDPNDDKNIFLEIRAGTGGDEAAIFAGDLYRMYERYAERQGWRLQVLSTSEGEHGGFKEIIGRIEGHGAYSKLKFESGAHRVQRVPETESQGRIHTSACTVAVLPETDDVGDIQINPADLRIDTFRSSGAGGQHVNTTDSAIRITHLPSGVVVECQDERSQHKNKAKAMSLLGARLKDAEEAKQHAEQSESRKLQVGSGDRSQRIRTYNYPQSRVSDHRINLTLYKLDEIMAGDLGLIIDPLISQNQADLLAELAD